MALAGTYNAEYYTQQLLVYEILILESSSIDDIIVAILAEKIAKRKKILV